MLELELHERTAWLQKYKPETLSIIDTQLDIAQKNILEFITTTSDKAKIESFVKNEIDNALSTFDTILNDDIKEISELAYFSTGAIMSKYVSDSLAKEFSKLKNPKQSTIDRINQTDVKIFGTKLSREKQKMMMGARDRLRGILSEGIRQGDSIQTMRTNIKNSIAITRNQADAITRTVTLKSLGESQSEVMDFFKDEIKEYFYDGISDSRQTAYCFGWTGFTSKNKSDITSKLWHHWRCRSSLGARPNLTDDEENEIFVTDWNTKTVNARDGGTYTKFKVGKTKRLSADSTNLDIFNVYSKDNQIRLIGKKRYDLWKSGKIPFNKLYNDSTKELILLKDLKVNL